MKKVRLKSLILVLNMFQKYTFFFLVLILFATSNKSYGKVLILNFSYNKPEFIEMQYKTFQKFLIDEFELVVFNDAPKEEMQEAIHQVCQKINILCIDIPQEIHNIPYLSRPKDHWTVSEFNAPSVRNCNVVQYALDTVGFKHGDVVILMESDIFLIKEFSFYNYLGDHALAGYNRAVEGGIVQRNLPFLWIGLIFIDMEKLLEKVAFSVNCGYINDIVIDSGGYTHFHINKQLDHSVKYFNKIRIEEYICKECQSTKEYRCRHNAADLQQIGFDTKTIQFIQNIPIDWGSTVEKNKGVGRRNIEFLLDNKFVHFYGASGYVKQMVNVNIEQFYKDKTNAFVEYINDLL